jgi:predicted RNase H-like HicB family nuclease
MESEVRQIRVAIHFEKDCVWGEVEEFPGCFAAGADLEEFREALAEAISIYLAPSADKRAVVHVDLDPPAEVKHVPARLELVPG